MGKAQITINGKTYTAPEGSSMSVINGIVYIDGERVADGLDDLPQPVHLEIKGKLHNLKVDGNVTVKGQVDGDIDAGGSVQCDYVYGSVDAGGSVSCGDVEGNVDAGGSINCGSVGGSVNAGGSIIARK